MAASRFFDFGRDGLASALAIALSVVLAGFAWTLPPLAQPPGYHDFADQRACWGLPRCPDIASNALFVLAGALGLRFMQRRRTIKQV